MPFFESLADVRARVQVDYERGKADLATLPGLPRRVAKVRAALVGAFVGIPKGLGKTFGVSGYEFYQQSFGHERSHDLGSWLGNAPIAQAVTSGVLAKGFTMALVGAGISPAWLETVGLHGTFIAGIGAFIMYTAYRYGSELMWPVILGAAGTQMTAARRAYDKHHPDHAPAERRADASVVAKAPAARVRQPVLAQRPTAVDERSIIRVSRRL